MPTLVAGIRVVSSQGVDGRDKPGHDELNLAFRIGPKEKEETTMDQKRYDIGLAKRRKVLGEAYVDRALQNVDDFNRDFQRLLTEYCWGETWGDETLSPRERSILNLGMIAALGKMEEFATHVRGALNNGLTPNEIRAALTQVLIYCGAPIGVDCFRVARPIIAEHQKAK
jgi:4-carboxymuconolactone decarboxylase